MCLDPAAKLILGVLYRERNLWERARGELTARFGPIDEQTLEFPFDSTDYYRAEMGPGLKRLFCSFHDPVGQDQAAAVKNWTNALETRLSEEREGVRIRRVNLDPGLIATEKLVMVTTKNFSHRIYLREGIFAEVTLTCRDGRFQPLEWTYPDYSRPDALEFFDRLRLEWRRRLRGGAPAPVQQSVITES